MMVAISFSMFKDKIRLGEKRQTIRPYSPNRYEQMVRIGRVQLYWKQRAKECEKLGEGRITRVFRIRFLKNKGVGEYTTNGWLIIRYSREREEDLARRDGFGSFDEMWEWFHDHYGERMFRIPFMVIRWELRGDA